jgi:hypothetical protein
MNKRRKTMMNHKKVIVALAAVALLVAFAVPAAATQLKFNGDMNHRFMLGTNHYDWFTADTKGTIDDGDVYDNFAEIKYRFWFEAASDDGAYKGVFATEIGGLTFGQQGSAGNRGMGYSGDQLALEFRWGYFDFQLPFAEQKSRLRIGLQPLNVNYFKWNETVGAVNLYGTAGSVDYQLAWARGYEVQNKNQDADDFDNDIDSLLGRVNLKPGEGLNVGLFALYEWNNIDDVKPGGAYTITPQNYEVKALPKNIDIDITTLGIDGGWKSGDFFAKWDLMYQTGGLDNVEYEGLPIDDYDLSAYFLHADLGMKMGKSTLTYTFWYASGDDDCTDDDFDAFISTDVDMFDSIVIMEGGWSDDDYFTERPYIGVSGFIMNKLAYDYQYSEKLKLGAAALYMMTAEDIEYVDDLGRNQSEDTLGLEVDVYFKYKLFKNVEWAVNAGYLFADDAMDAFEEDSRGGVFKDGSSDEDIWRADMRIRYKF